MEKVFELAQLVRTVEQMVYDDGVSRHTIFDLRHHGKLYNIHRGLYIDSEKYHALPPWDKYMIQHLAFARVAKNPVFSHESAAIFQSLCLINVPRKIHVYCAPSSRGSSRDVSKHPLLTDAVETPDCFGVANARTTSLQITVIDCAAKMSFREGVVLADSVFREHPVSLESLRDSLLSFRGKNSARVHAVARAMSAKSESPGETLTRLILDELGLDYQEQYSFRYENRSYRADFYVEELNLFIEFDGQLKYEVFQPREEVVHLERRREREMMKMGHRLFRVDWDDVYRRPERTKAELKRYIAQIQKPQKAA
ncbi:MAG: hypothetical protein Q3974_01700 [Rothia sp. (in: high G+C Gram-positive bacteria)]|nr:hypothetical protein [Rothia sp. (in: high G+C Gram-positive bacteria)]